MNRTDLTPFEIEMLEILRRIPEDRRPFCRDFLKTHAAIPEKPKSDDRVVGFDYFQYRRWS